MAILELDYKYIIFFDTCNSIMPTVINLRDDNSCKHFTCFRGTDVEFDAFPFYLKLSYAFWIQ
jgi:hypothetical protein